MVTRKEVEALLKKRGGPNAPKKQHTPDYYPVVRETYLGDDTNGAFTGTHAGDAGQILSIVNRRLYRYGKLYQLKLDLDIPSTFGGEAVVEVFALRNNWDTQRAYALAKATFDEAYAEETKSGSGANIARWRDFRIASGVTGAGVIDPCNYDAATLAINVENVGEHGLSSVDVGGTETYFTWGNASANTLSIPAEWTNAGRAQTDPNTISTNAPYDGVNADQASNIEKSALGNTGNNPPYSNTSSNDLLTKVATLYFRAGAIGLSKLSTGFFDAPCGLFIVKVNTTLPNGYLRLTAKSGDYKGVMAKDMAQE